MEGFLRKGRRWSLFISRCFNHSSRKDQLIQVLRENIESCTWYPCCQDLENWVDWERFAALAMLIVAVGPDWPQDEVLHPFLQTSHS